jgi:membrane protein implicated in regulation of membrane protease activity
MQPHKEYVMNPYKKKLGRNAILSLLILVVGMVAFQLNWWANFPVFVIIGASLALLVYVVMYLMDYEEDDGKDVARGIGSGFAEGLKLRK